MEATALIDTYLIALAITLGLEVPAVALCFPGQRKRMALACVVATCVTHLFMHFALPRLVQSYDQWLLYGELLALVLEGIVYWLVSRPRDLGRALVASAIANTLSYGVGLWVFSA